MSKANNRKDIKKKQELQAMFQIAIGQANNTVLSWLKPHGTTKAIDNSLSAEHFMSLPVISLGSGLSLSEENRDDADIHTIGDFVNGTKKLSTLSKKKRASTIDEKINRINNRHKVAKNDSKSTVALKNKLRDSNREKVRNSLIKVTQKERRGNVRADEGSDSDNEETEVVQRNVKKGSNLLFDSRISKKR